MQDPVRLAVKEVLKAEREKSQNVQNPGPGHYVGEAPSPHAQKHFSVKPGNFNSNSPRFPAVTDKSKARHYNSATVGLNDDIDPNMPIYDLQMQEGPQIKARLLMREL